mmetsp:Transcript_17163/g.39898  ORF Transcript_17163/g.39898 Transcript_17163/m.39898 type:complete len:519 (+) Transcript_17163:122-1678(+)
MAERLSKNHPADSEEAGGASMAGAPPPDVPGDTTFAPISARVNPNANGYAPGATVAASLLADQLALRALEAQIASQQIALSTLQAQIAANQQNAAVISRRLMMTSRYTNGMQHQSISSALGNNFAGGFRQLQVLPQSLQQQQHLNLHTNILANSILSASSSGAQPPSSTLFNFTAPSASVQMPSGVVAFGQSQNPTAFSNIQQQKGALGQSPGLEAQPNTQINLLATAALAASEPNGTQKLCPTLSPDRFKADARPTTGNAGLGFADQAMNQTGPGDGGNHQQQTASSQERFRAGPTPSTEPPLAMTHKRSEPVSVTSASDTAAHQQDERAPSKKSGVDSAATLRTVKIGLASIPVEGGHREESGWEKQFKALKLWRLENGHCNVPARCETDARLGRWVMTQRRQYALMKDGKPSAMTQSRIDLLESIDFSWSIRPKPQDTWQHRFAELLAFQREKGHCIVPQRCKENPQLGTWVHTQRRQYKLKMEGKSNSMTQDKINSLNGIQFEWDGRPPNQDKK